MKNLLLLTFFLISFSSTAQTNTFNGGVDTLWNTAANWSLNQVPSMLQDVVIPTGKSVNLNVSSSIKTLHLVGSAVMTMNSDLTNSQAFTIDANATLTWNSGALYGAGVITNNGTLNTPSSNNLGLFDGKTLNNNHIINMTSSSTIFVYNATVNNTTTGIINITSNNAGFGYGGVGSHILNNSGLIKISNLTISANIDLLFTNSGTITVETGVLTINNQCNFNGGVYNINQGATLEWTTLSTITISGTLTGMIVGTLNWNGDVNVISANPATFNFTTTGTGTVNWRYSNLKGGGILTNAGTLITGGAGSSTIIDNTTLQNTGNLNITSSFRLSDGVLLNTSSGTITMVDNSGFDSYTTTASHLFQNQGLLTKTATSGFPVIQTNFVNTGTIAVPMGSFKLDSQYINLQSGTYNISQGATLEWTTSSTITCSGTLTGNIAGNLDWNGDVKVIASNPATFNFTITGTGTVNWRYSNLKGGGILTNLGTLTAGGAGGVNIIENTTLQNNNILNVTNGFHINNGTLNNSLTNAIINVNDCIIDFNGAGTHNLTNNGILQKTIISANYTDVNVNCTNTGIIKVVNGNLRFLNFLTNATNGRIEGNTTLFTPTPISNFTNNGKVAPGNPLGILAISGDYSSTASTHLEVQLNGFTQGTQYDKLAINGNAVFLGTIDVILNFAPAIGNQFIVATTSGTITTCSLPATVSAVYNGNNYAFTVACITNNQVVLTLSSITLSNEEFSFDNALKVYPNPVSAVVYIDNQSSFEIKEITIYDFQGRVVKKRNQSNSVLNQLDVSDLTSGTYLVKLNSGEHQSIKKIVVN